MPDTVAGKTSGYQLDHSLLAWKFIATTLTAVVKAVMKNPHYSLVLFVDQICKWETITDKLVNLKVRALHLLCLIEILIMTISLAPSKKVCAICFFMQLIQNSMQILCWENKCVFPGNHGGEECEARTFF